MDGLRHYGGLEHPRTRPWGLVQQSMRKGLQVYVAWVKEEERHPKTGGGREKRKRQTRLMLHLG